MNTTVYKANALIDSALNLKYHVFRPQGEGVTMEMLFTPYANLSQSFQFKIISYNSTCAKASTGNSNASVLTLVDTTVVGDDTIYTYTFTTPSTTFPCARVQFTSSCTKILIEDIEGMVVAPYAGGPLCSLDSAKLHANKVTIPRPMQSSGLISVYGILRNTFCVREPEKAFTLDDIAEIIPYYNTIMLTGCTNFECDIADLVSLVCITQEYTSPKDPSYSGLRISVGETKVYGKLSEAFNVLKERRYKWGCQIVFGGSLIQNDINTNTDADSCTCDEFGTVVDRSSVTNMYSYIPNE